jgi:molybdopterin converting factor small subunit
MRLKLSYGRQVLFSDFSENGRVTVEQILKSTESSHPDIYKRLCNREGLLRDSLPVFVNGDHIRYRNGLKTEVTDGDEVYVVPLLTGG